MAETLLLGSAIKLGIAAGSAILPKIVSAASIAAPYIVTALNNAAPIIEAISNFSKVSEMLLETLKAKEEITPKLLEAFHQAMEHVKPPNVTALGRNILLQEYQRNLKIIEAINAATEHLPIADRQKNNATLKELISRTQAISEQYQKLTASVKPQTEADKKNDQQRLAQAQEKALIGTDKDRLAYEQLKLEINRKQSPLPVLAMFKENEPKLQAILHRIVTDAPLSERLQNAQQSLIANPFENSATPAPIDYKHQQDKTNLNKFLPTTPKPGEAQPTNPQPTNPEPTKPEIPGSQKPRI